MGFTVRIYGRYRIVRYCNIVITLSYSSLCLFSPNDLYLEEGNVLSSLDI